MSRDRGPPIGLTGSLLALLLLLSAFSACPGRRHRGEGDADADADSDADGDTDTDADADWCGEGDCSGYTCPTVGGRCYRQCDLCFASFVDGTCPANQSCCSAGFPDPPLRDCVEIGGECLDGCNGLWPTAAVCDVGSCCVDVACDPGA